MTLRREQDCASVVDDRDDKAVNLQISATEVRALTVTGKLPIEGFNLTPGPHDLKVLITVPGQNANTQVLPLHTRFSIDP